MKTKLYVPLMLSSITPDTRPLYVRDLRAMEADVMWIAPDRYTLFLPDRTFLMEQIREHIAYFRNAGLEVGLWIQAFGFGDGLPEMADGVTETWTKLRSMYGGEAGDAFCPEDPAFMAVYLDWVKDMAACSPSLLMLDDDLCQSVRPGLGCWCHRHRALLNERLTARGLAPLGEDPAVWGERFFTGKGNTDRRVFLDVMGDSLRTFCRRVREAVDGVDPAIRVGFCAGYTSWDIEGAPASELSRILAGHDTKPFLRLTGAPYWVTHDMHRFAGQRLNTVIEFARAQESWCRIESGDMEIFAEADSYPRPRYHVASAYIDTFDLACRASGGMGMLKYVFDYYASPENESGYLKRHLRLAAQYDRAENLFSGKTARGVYVCEPMEKVADMTLPTPFIGEGAVMHTAFSPAATMLSALSIPTAYDLPADGVPDCAIAFGDCVTALNQMPKKLILDLPAALRLQEAGVDVGISEVIPGAEIPLYERYEQLDGCGVFVPGHTSLQFQYAPYSRVVPREGAEILSVFEGRTQVFPSAYRYQNGKTELYVLCADAYALRPNCSILLSYGRQNQLLDFIGGIPHVAGEPCVYTLWKEGADGGALLVLNLSEDVLFDFDIVLDKAYDRVILHGAEGIHHGDRVHITGEVAPFAAVMVEMRA